MVNGEAARDERPRPRNEAERGGQILTIANRLEEASPQERTMTIDIGIDEANADPDEGDMVTEEDDGTETTMMTMITTEDGDVMTTIIIMKGDVEDAAMTDDAGLPEVTKKTPTEKVVQQGREGAVVPGWSGRWNRRWSPC